MSQFLSNFLDSYVTDKSRSLGKLDVDWVEEVDEVTNLAIY